MPVSKTLCRLRADRRGHRICRIAGIKHNKIIAKAVHFQKFSHD
jgi:hypothetical protein